MNGPLGPLITLNFEPEPLLRQDDVDMSRLTQAIKWANHSAKKTSCAARSKRGKTRARESQQVLLQADCMKMWREVSQPIIAGAKMQSQN